jgi:hypothetical protein
LVLFFIAGGFNNSLSWDSTAAKLYPMAVGNTWSYNYKTYNGPSGCIILATETNYIVRIVSDTVMPNGRRYFKFDDRGSFYYRRIDSVKMNIYQYSTSSGNECLYDTLKATVNNQFSGCSFGTIITGITTEFIFGMNRIRRDSRPTPCPGCGRTLVEGLGFYADFLCLTGGNRTTLNGCIINGIQYGQIIGVNEISSEIPVYYSLFQNYPNPFNPSTNIKFQIPKSGFVKLTVFDVLGKEIGTLVKEQLSPGTYQADFDATNLPSGVYYYSLEFRQAGSMTGEFSQTRKMVLIK